MQPRLARAPVSLHGHHVPEHFPTGHVVLGPTTGQARTRVVVLAHGLVLWVQVTSTGPLTSLTEATHGSISPLGTVPEPEPPLSQIGWLTQRDHLHVERTQSQLSSQSCVNRTPCGDLHDA